MYFVGKQEVHGTRERTGRKRKTKDKTKAPKQEQAQLIEPYRKNPKMSQFEFESVIIYPAQNFIQSNYCDTLGVHIQLLKDMLTWTRCNSKSHVQKND